MPASDFVETPVEEIEKKRELLRDGFKSGKLKTIEYRKYQLLQLMYMIRENEERFDQALIDDTGRPALETRLVEVNGTISELLTAYKNVEKWAAPEKPAFNLQWYPMKPTIHKEAKGTVLIICPFNYPVWLSIGPIAGAIAAGNTVLLKPSESTPSTSALLTELIAKYIDPDVIQVVNGAIPQTSRLLELQWDHILYTGSGRVAKIVAAAAAKHLTPLTLELGGKTPVFIDPACDLPVTARRLLWGKVVNGGQTCVAPDYVLVPRSFQDALVAELEKVYKEFYPEGPSAGKMARVTTEGGWKRLTGLLGKTKGKVVLGGGSEEKGLWIEPTVVRDVAVGDCLMEDEIFGPILPIVPVEDLDEALAYVNAHDHPLCIYVFSQDDKYKRKVMVNTQSGGISMNETIFLTGAEGLPFGGTGASGYGYHTGKFSFDIFTHLRASIDNPSWVDKIIGFRFPPFNEKKLSAVLRMGKSLPAKPTGPPAINVNALRAGKAPRRGWGKWVAFLLAVVAAAGVKRLGGRK